MVPRGTEGDEALDGRAALNREVTGPRASEVVGLQAEAVTAWLVANVHGVCPPLRFDRVCQGYSNLTFLVTDAGGLRFILRRPPLDQLLASAHDVAREHRILCALQDTKVPTPAVLAFTGYPAITAVPLLAMSYIEDLVTDDPRIVGGLGSGVETVSRFVKGNSDMIAGQEPNNPSYAEAQAHRALMGEHGGAIVNVSSVAGLRPAPGIGFYGASKAILSHITAELAIELDPNVRVNAVAPAVVKTKFATAPYEGREDEVAAAYPLKRLGVPEDIGSVVAFLLSEDAAWVTGQIIIIDGGVTLTGGV